MASRLIPRFFRIGEMCLNPRFVKCTNQTPSTASITMANTENQVIEHDGWYCENKNRDLTYTYDITEHPKQYQQVMKMIETLCNEN